MALFRSQLRITTSMSLLDEQLSELSQFSRHGEMAREKSTKIDPHTHKRLK